MPEEQPPAPLDAPEDFTSSAAASETSFHEKPPSTAATDSAVGFEADEIEAPVPPDSNPAVVEPTPASPDGLPKQPDNAIQSQTLRSLQTFWQTTQPRVKAGTVTVLKTIITALEQLVVQLEAAPPATTADRPPPIPPTTSPTWLNQLWQTFQTGWQSCWRWWRGILPKIRGVLPTAVNEALSDRALTGAIVGVLLLVLWIGSSLFASPPPKQVAVVPPPQSTPAKPTASQESSPKSKTLPEVKVIPSPKPAPVSPPVIAKPTPTPVGQPTPAVSPAPSPRPSPAPPPLKLTPEQTLIARIQDQVAEVSNQYVNGLIQAVQANFRASRLTVKVGDGWYGLLPAQQDNLANDMLKRAQQLNFVKLEVTDTKGMLLARSPVVGTEMVVLRRSTS